MISQSTVGRPSAATVRAPTSNRPGRHRWPVAFAGPLLASQCCTSLETLQHPIVADVVAGRIGTGGVPSASHESLARPSSQASARGGATRRARRRERAGAAAAGLLLLALATLGCSNPDDERPAIEASPAATTSGLTTTEPTQPDGQPATTTAEQEPPATAGPNHRRRPSHQSSLPSKNRHRTTAPSEAAVEPEEPQKSEDDDEDTLDDSGAEVDSDSTAAEASTESDGSFEIVTTSIPPDLINVQLLPWDGGFLNLGYLRAAEKDEAPCNASQLRIRTSDDGLQWTEFSSLEIPSVHAMPSDFSGHDDFYIDCRYFQHRFPSHIASDGTRLAIVSQWPIGLETWAGVTPNSAALLDASIQIRPTIHLSVTEDLVTWDTIEILIDSPEDLHESLHRDPHVTDLSLHDDGWLLELTTLTYMNFFALMPDDIRDSASMARPDFSGAWYDETSGEDGVTVEWSTYDNPYVFSNTRFVSWDELGTTQALFDKYGPNNQPYPLGELYSGSLLVASWGEDPKSLSLPYDAKYSHVVVTDAGYLALSDPSEAGYHPGWFGSGTLFFSANGEEWVRINRLAGDEIWMHSIRGVNGGVVAFGSPSPRSAAFFEDDWMNHFWLGNPDGSSWEPLDLPAYTSLMEWLITNDRAPIGWPGLAVQGNIVLRTEYDASTQTFGSGEPFTGRIRRYVVPD